MNSHKHKLHRRVKTIVLFTTILYVLMGIILIWQVSAQPLESPIATGTVHKVPTGNDDKAVLAYYDYLAQASLTVEHQTYTQATPSLGWTYGVIGATLIMFFFFTYAWYARHAKGDLYPIESYNGYITERGGPVDSFNWAFYTIVGSFMLYYMITHIIYGQLY